MNLLRRVGRRLAALVLLLPLALALVVHADVRAAIPVADFGRFDSFPASVAGYARGDVMAYAPHLADFSIAYDSRSFSLQNAVTLFFYPHRHDDPAAQLADEEQQVLRAHEGARVVGRRDVTLSHGAASREATLVSFEFDGDFAGSRQPLASQLLLVFRGRNVFMVRSTAPQSQGALAERAMLELVQRVDWESVPDR